jgi:hypothetical protein
MTIVTEVRISGRYCPLHLTMASCDKVKMSVGNY